MGFRTKRKSVTDLQFASSQIVYVPRAQFDRLMTTEADEPPAALRSLVLQSRASHVG